MSTCPGMSVSVAHGRVQGVKIVECEHAHESGDRGVVNERVKCHAGYARGTCGASGTRGEPGCAGAWTSGEMLGRVGSNRTGEPTMYAYAHMFDRARAPTMCRRGRAGSGYAHARATPGKAWTCPPRPQGEKGGRGYEGFGKSVLTIPASLVLRSTSPTRKIRNTNSRESWEN